MKKSITLESRFTILRQLGAGGFSRVYKVQDKSNNNQVLALKILFLDINQEDAKEELEAFDKEVKHLKALQHDSIVRIVEDLVVDNHPAILMELVEGESLQEMINKEKVLSVDEVLEIVLQVSSALYASHTFQIPRHRIGENPTMLYDTFAIVHNDISAKNIIREQKEDGTINYKLIDFGLSYVPSEVKSGENMSKGTLEYYPPEKWRGEKVDTRADIYSLGVVLYQMLAGRVPFEIEDYSNQSQIDLARKHHLESNIPDLWEIRKEKLLHRGMLTSEDPDYPYWLQLLIEKCLAKTPEERFRTGEDLNRYYHEGRRGNLPTEWPTIVDNEMEEAWLAAYSENTIESLENFIKKYPKSKYIAQANEELDYLKEIERKKKLEKIEWNKALQKNTVEAYKQFIDKYPQSQYTTTAQEKMKAVDHALQAWQKTQQKNTKSAYQLFLKQFPQSEFAVIAQRKIKEYPSVFQGLNEIITNNKKLVFFLVGFGLIVFVGFSFREQIQDFIDKIYTEQQHKEPITLVKNYYKAFYIEKDYDKILDTYLAYPVQYNGQTYNKTSFTNKLKEDMQYIPMNRNYNVVNKKVKIDSLVQGVNKQCFRAYGHFSFEKQRKGKRAVQKTYTIKEKLLIANGKIQAIEKVK